MRSHQASKGSCSTHLPIFAARTYAQARCARTSRELTGADSYAVVSREMQRFIVTEFKGHHASGRRRAVHEAQNIQANRYHTTPMIIYLDGKYVPEEEAKVSVFDHGLLYGDGVFEGIRAYNGRVFRLD